MLGKSAAALIVSAALAMPAGAGELFTLVAGIKFVSGAGGCTVGVTVQNHSGKLLETLTGTVSIHSASGASIGTSSLRFEYVDPKGFGEDRIWVKQHCSLLPTFKLRTIDRCVMDGVRYTGCLEFTTVEVEADWYGKGFPPLVFER